MKNFKQNFKSIVQRKARWLLTLLAILTLGVGQMWGAAKERYIYCGISEHYDTYKDGSNWGFNFWGGTSVGVKSVTYIQDDYHDGRNYKVFRVQVYDDNNKAQFKGNNDWWIPGDGYSCTLNGTTNNAVYFSAEENGWYGQFQKSFMVSSTGSLSASSTSVVIGANVTLTPSLSSNSTYNEIKSTSYDVTTNPNSGGSVTSAGVFSATKAGTYVVTATITYNAKDFTGITKTVDVTKTITVYATVTFDKEGGSNGANSQNAIYGNTVSDISTPSKDYHDFAGYWTGDDGTGTMVINASGAWQKNISNFTDNSSTAKWIILTNQTLHAKWTPKNYSITYKDQGNVAYSGSNSASLPSSYTYGTGTALTDGVKSGYRFDGWFDNSSCTGSAVTSISSSATGAKTFYAKWTENPGGTVTLTAETGGRVSKDGSSWGASTSYSGIKSATPLNIYAQANIGYTFNTWTISSGSGTITTNAATGVFTPVADADATLTASFTENMSSLTTSNSYDAGDPSYAAPSVSGSATTVGYATTRTITAASAGTGYTFTGWTLTNCTRTDGGGATANPITVRSNGDGAAVTVVANYNEDRSSRWHLVGNSSDFPDGWNVNSTTMMQKKTGHSTESAVYFTVDVTSTDTKEFKVVDDNGASSDIWYGYSSGDTYLTWTATSTKTVYAKDEGETDHNANNLKYTPTVTGPYEFKVDYSGTYPAVTITYPVSYTLTYSIGSVAGTDGSISTSPTTTSGSKVLSGSTVNLTAPEAKTGYTWKGWYTNAAGTTGKIDDVSQAITVTVDADKTLYACYTENTYSTSVAVSPEGYGSISSPTPAEGKINVSHHTGTSVTASANTNYVFDHWAVSDGGLTVNSTTANPATFKATSTGGTITAHFDHQWCLKGDQWSTWTESKGMPLDVGTVFETTLTLTKGQEYKFKVHDRKTNTWYGNTKDAGEHAMGRGDAAYATTSGSGEDDNLTITPDVTGDYTFSFNTSNSELTVTYPTAYTVTFGKGTGGSTITASATSAGGLFTSGDYVASGDNVTFTQTPSSSGYTFKGWYTTVDGNTSAGVDGEGKLTINGAKTVYAQYTANTYTLSFNVNGGTASTPDSRSVTYGSAYGTLPSGMTHASKTFIGWYDDADDGEGNHITAETIVSTASNHTLYAHYESVYAVNVDFKCGDAKVYPSTSVNASPTSLQPTIIAPEIFGYSFNGWTGSNATFADANSATTTVNATAATTVTANYEVVPMVYFKNNLGWDSVFVSFDITWTTAAEKQVPVNNGKPYFAMTQIGSTDVYYCEIPSTYTSSNYASWSANIAFDNKNYNYKATASAHTGNMESFYEGEFTGRGDFDPKATMYIPYNGDTEARNSGTFYKTGCWMKYNSTESGYRVNMNTYVTGEHADTLLVDLKAANAGGYEFSAKLNLKHANYSYGFKLYKHYEKISNDIWYTNTGTINAGTETLPWHFWAGTDVTATSTRCGLHTEALGDYTITVSFATGRPEVNVEYPTSVGDWRLAYNDRIAWSYDTHAENWYLYSSVIKAKANAKDIASFYVSKANGANASIELQKCTAIDPSTGAETWTKQSDVSLSSITKTGFYNFQVTQDGSKEASAAYEGAYSGNFYIRTDASDGGWTNYKSSKNLMTYSEFSDTNNKGFTHYFMRYVTSGSNIKFCIANDYNPCVTEYCVDDNFTGEWIEANGNVRFMWNQKTNAVSRAYISGSSTISDRFLVLEGDDKMFDETGKDLTDAGDGKISGLNDYEMNFTDDQNWIYEATVKAKPGARVKLTAKYNGYTQYFYGAEGDRSESTTELLLGGSSDAKYKMHVVYDFKTNRLVKAFMPDGNIEDHLTIEADMMIIREHQGDADQITFNGGSLSEVKTVYGAMKFNKYTVNGKSKEAGHAATGESRYKRDLFYISFPFDVKLSEAFGFGTYGTHWIIEYYDGKNRAKNGFWADSDSNWKFVTPAQRNSFTMKAFEGYILALDLDNMTESASIWDNGVEDVYIYFPSSEEVKDIEATDRLVTIDQTDYECTINRSTPDGDRRVKDSYWHCIGVPSFANYSSTLYDENGGTAIDWRSTSMPYLYEWNSADNSLSITSSETFSFKATYSYIVQYAGESIYWSSVNVTPSSAPAARRVDGYKSEYEFRLELLKGEEKADQTFVKLTDDEHVTTGFEFNYDLSKEFNKNKANIYTMVSTTIDGDISVTQSAANVLPFMPEQTTVVPVGVKTTAAGEYTFAIPDGTEGIGVTLIDNVANTRTNLGLTDYTVTLNQGKIDGRFMLEISPISQISTDIEAVSDQHSAVRKVMIDGLLYIVKDGVVYDAQGKRVQ